MLSKISTIIFPTGKHSSKYKQFITWSFASTVLVSIQTVLTTNSMLDVVTDSGEYKMLNYIGKDIIGQMGGVVYMSKMAEKSDKEPEKFINISNAIQQSSFVILSITPLIDSSVFLPIAGVSNTLANISFSGYGTINAKCIQKMALDDNIGELYGKITAINTVGSSLGLTIGIGISMYLPDVHSRCLVLPLIGVLRVFTYNKAVSGLLKK